MTKFKPTLLLLGFLLLACFGYAQAIEHVHNAENSLGTIQVCTDGVNYDQAANEQVTDFFSGIFSTMNWPARWNCGIWSPFHGWFSITSDFLVWLSYFTIPGILFFFLHKKQVPKQFRKVFWLFIAFILCCGLTHLMEVIIFWWPAYRLNTTISFLTASVSIATVFSLVGILPASLKYKSPEEMQSIIVERTRLLKEKTNELEQINKELKHFAYVVSHDLKAPLANIESLVNLLESRKSEFKDGDLVFEKIHKTINQSKEKIEALNSVLEIRNVEETAEHNTNVQDTLNDTLLIIDELIKERNAKIQTDIDPTLTVNVPRVYLSTIFQNLITNAIKYQKTDKHSIINIRGNISSGIPRIEIEDNGRGIDLAKFKEKFFGLFQRFHLDVEGNGVGLYITKNLMETFGGTIEIESEVNVGSTFKLIFSKKDGSESKA
ncbi:MAG: HAMP domain-containing histidine kinase [Cyclobacteriaceae bacterium]|nr:HAMP domain-containing histidine kinase [Cyclobacteriaceae bacterium SS2]